MVRISFVTCLLLIGLRLMIGWHFLFEGIHKYEATKRGESEIGKPFSSAGYFAEAEGPIGSWMREKIGDADAAALAKFELVDSGDDKPASKMPVALGKEWDQYADQFKAYYRLSDDAKKQVDAKLEQAKADFVLWRKDETPNPKDGKKTKDDPMKIKKTIVSKDSTIEYEIDDNITQRVLDYQMKLREIRDVYEIRLRKFEKDVEKASLRTLKAEAATMRSALMKDVDVKTKRMKESLATVIAKDLSGVNVPASDDPFVDDGVLSLLTLKDGTEASSSRMPVALNQQWNDYLSYVREYGQDNLRRDPQRGEEMLNDAKLRYVRYLLDLDQYTGDPLPEKEVAPRIEAYGQAVVKLRAAEKTQKEKPSKENEAVVASAAKTTAKLRQAFVDSINKQTDILKQNLGGFKIEKEKGKEYDSYKGTVGVEKEKAHFLWRDWPTTKLEWLDWSTRWGLLIAGGCVLVGLFTRLACLFCAGFLVMEYLSNSPFSWLPVSPKAEGNYTFVNKNVVELLALLVLATLPTGRWLGLDAILSRIWPFRRRSR